MVTSFHESAQDKGLSVMVSTPSGRNEYNVISSELRKQFPIILSASGVSPETQHRILDHCDGNPGSGFSYREGEGGFDEGSVLVVISNGFDAISGPGRQVRFASGQGWHGCTG